MSHVLHWLWGAWDAIWPNLAANVLWVPAAWAHHVLTKRHMTRLQSDHEQKVQDLHGKIDELTRKVAGDDGTGS